MLKQGLFNTAPVVIRLFVGILTIPILIRLLGLENYGVWSLVSAIIGMFSLAEIGLSSATTIFISQDIATEKLSEISASVTMILVLVALISLPTILIIHLSADVLVSHISTFSDSQQNEATQALKIGSFHIVVRLFQQVATGIQHSHYRYKAAGLINAFHSIILNFALVSIVELGGGIPQMMHATLIVGSFSLFSHIAVSRKLIVSFKPAVSIGKGKAILDHCFSVFLGAVGGALFSRGDRIVVGGLLGAQNLGIYSTIVDIVGQINPLCTLPIQPLVPAVSSWNSGKTLDFKSIEVKVKQALYINCVISLGCGGALLSMPTFLLKKFLPIDTNPSYYSFYFFAICIYTLYSFNAVGYFILTGLKCARICTQVLLVSGLLSLIFIWIGTYFYGIGGAIIGNSGFLLTLILLEKGFSKLQIVLTDQISSLIFPLLSTFFVFVLNWLASPTDWTKISIFICHTLLLSAWFLYQNRRLSRYTSAVLESS